MNKSLLERLLDFYHIDYSQYLSLTKEVDLSNFRNGHEFKDIDKAVKLVKEAITKDEKIIIYGDYDADGVMGTSILVKMFEYLGVIVDYYLPNRYLDGYGLNILKAKEYVENGYNLVITVDNGITANEAISYLREHNVNVLILDHHQQGEVLPNANAICHPIISEFGETATSGAFTAFIFSISLLGKVDKYLATLASISLISDMMPLVDYNRNLLRAIFKDYQDGEFMALSLLADHEPLNESLIGMKIAPRINSIGRLCEDHSINEIVKYFTTSDKEFILNYYNHIVNMNEERKSFSKIDVEELNIDVSQPAIIIRGDFKEGIIGLVANSVMMKYHKPVIVFTKSADNSLKGSARAPEGYDLVDCFSKVKDYFLTSGGHASAAGCSIKIEDFENFKKDFNDVISTYKVEVVEIPYIDILMNELNFENVELINSFAPFGEGWPSANFRLRRIKVDALMYSKDHKHIITSLGNKLKLVYFSYPSEKLENQSFIDFVGTLNIKEYKGFKYIEFTGKEILPTQS